MSVSWLFIPAALFACLLLGLQRKAEPSPPGPRGLPFLGSALDLPTKFVFRKFDEWSKLYDGWFTLSAAGQKFLVITRADVAVDILDKMSVQTSDRPALPMVRYMLRRMSFPFDNYNDRWRRCRRLAHENFNIQALDNYRTLYEHATAKLLRRLPDVDPMQLREELTQFSGALAYEALYGRDAGGVNQRRNIHRVWKLLEVLGDAASPATFLINLMPSLDILPESLSPWKQFGTRYFNENDKFFMEMAQPGLTGQSDSGFVASCARMRDRTDGISDAEIAWTSFSLYGAGVETTPYTLHWFVMAMVLFPEVYQRAQGEVSTVAGNRPPTFEHRSKLPYLVAVMKETLRWRPVLPAGLPHTASEDFLYKQFRIRKGTYVFANQWSMCRDPAVYPDFELFKPERFLADPPPPDPPVFGFGRRICPGRNFAQEVLFLAMANLLWAFHFEKATEPDGKVIIPSPDSIDGNILLRPQPFPFVITPRQEIPN
ncbi:cytochrome P450 [Dacryopinax primogenitus]|uniref:Cytochrome P450 n=1 Tax=Dacryopinax primogenitus (strain DJM 731) TaxID=1858805 RepID=M5FTJ4_DACPD|nr:cytochrome P450 [Dacryopinax primogenitus]EJT96566.1 cytochrome P450 [Dacryopinax primogenitus]